MSKIKEEIGIILILVGLFLIFIAPLLIDLFSRR